jgi:hypothetical protein
MKKFNGFEKHLLQEALKRHIVELEAEVLEHEKLDTPNRLMFAPGYFTMLGDDLHGKINEMTLKVFKD